MSEKMEAVAIVIKLYLNPDPEMVKLLEEACGVLSLYVHIGAAHPDVKNLVGRIDAKLAEVKR